jgi:hypothetical protein
MILQSRYKMPDHLFWPTHLIQLQDFLPNLKDHLLGCLLNRDHDGDKYNFTDQEQQDVTLVNNRMYRHKVLCVNYTTYDCRCAQDWLNPRTHSDIMVLAHEDDNERDKHP